MEEKRAGLTYEEASRIAEECGEELSCGYCPMCGPNKNCRTYRFVKDGKLVRLAGMSESSFNRGAMCAKGLAAIEWNDSPDRIKSPLLRIGEKGEGKFKEISWDEAVDIIAEKLLEQKEKYGPETLAMLSPGAREYKEISLRFLAVHGSPNHAHSGICAMQNSFSYCYTIGGRPSCDFANADLVVYWGKQPAYSGPANDRGRDLINSKKQGSTIVCVKPSMEADGAIADMWVPVRPGTDAALALSMLHVVMEEDLVDHAFVDQWCYGFEKLKNHVRQYTPEWGEKISGVPAAQIIEFTRLYATTPRACIETGNGLEHSASASSTVRAIASLMAVTGHLNRPGTNLLGKGGGRGGKNIMRFDLYTKELMDKILCPEMPREFMPFREGPATSYYKTIESVVTGKPYKIRTLIAPGTQPLLSNRGTKVVLEALKQVDFYVCIDVMRTAEYPYADIVLPVANFFEMEHPVAAEGNLLIPRPGCVASKGDYKTIYHFFLELADKMGYGEDFWHGNYEEFENDNLAGYGVTVDEVRRHPRGLKIDKPKKPYVYEDFEKAFSARSTRLGKPPYLPQKKVALYNTTFEEFGYEPLPAYREPAQSLTGSPELAEKYPLLLSDYHTSRAYTASWLRNIPSLRRIQPEPVIQINTDTAAVRGIKDGDMVKVESPNGWLLVKAETTQRIRPDTVMILHGWWMGCKELGIEDGLLTDGGANVNAIYDTSDKAFDPLVTAMSSQALVEVSKYNG